MSKTNLLAGLHIRVQFEFISIAFFNLSIYFRIKRLKNCTQFHTTAQLCEQDCTFLPCDAYA